MWVFNVFLYLMFLLDPTAYEALKQAGAPCYVYVSDLGSGNVQPAQPVCTYDPSNVNQGN